MIGLGSIEYGVMTNRVVDTADLIGYLDFSWCTGNNIPYLERKNPWSRSAVLVVPWKYFYSSSRSEVTIPWKT